MSDPDQPPVHTGRVRVTSPLASASRHVPRSARQEIDESTGVGELYMRSLIRSQLRAALTVVVTLLLSIGALPIVFLTVDASTTLRLFGIPAPWIVLGVLVYPFIGIIGWLFVRQAERAERDFADLVDATETRDSASGGPA
ncbi:hypothetical protein [Aeromicrobium sp. CF3.5]|uniref:hypothetical protein n=1 Tax=Aeromicrobium sp. CF3.5 TaxID=3373078 RepID=UPI003EE731E4